MSDYSCSDDALIMIAEHIAGFFAGQPMAETRLSAPPIAFATSVHGELWRMLVRRADGSLRVSVVVVAMLLTSVPLLGVCAWRVRRQRRQRMSCPIVG